MLVTSVTPSRNAQQRRVLAGACLAHALHDGFSDLIYVLLPVWQMQFRLRFSALAMLRGLYVGMLAVLQMPSISIARRFGAPPCSYLKRC